MAEYKEKLKNFKLKKDPLIDGEYLTILEASKSTQNGDIPLGEMGFDKQGLVTIKNNTSSLYNVFNTLINGLTTFNIALAANAATEPAAAAAATTLAATLIAVQEQISTLLSPS